MPKLLMLGSNGSGAFQILQQTGEGKHWEVEMPFYPTEADAINVVARFKPDVVIVPTVITGSLQGPALICLLRGLDPPGLWTRPSIQRLLFGQVLVHDTTIRPFIQAGVVVAGKTNRTVEGMRAELERLRTELARSSAFPPSVLEVMSLLAARLPNTRPRW